ncbi:nicotinate phosphoribosyltransferase [Trichophyton rubrum D6]|uniref:Nicotinate phosphoribosyltransferase n=3 Tax=Trichophyton TaxID=5550 RepID=A0A080WP41_TRIRC|nr:nicotinate phosphoribosyltransferase [Trichophyton rubrum CBS 118892]EZF24170.1 nicotinate phosphoribosyltransferase [Trichophyton rubrum MR850]EZF43210.1 nicotinate phosphoribosyltransferase [Trichophyton rubrum CBS 100081]EZF53868.1 nicotinate phosphoribosyltransferase [Trichophyton rubrum CBS 288.86]EZF64471.1 nicotinate phosphoribosyltransferase [Trichophyton rubrum CBS 289.86]EZF75098.1 nicotinate phosphoribosyltransferase [Trichophyton soudanense CBS 452.61]EZF96569.1 nicotinate phos
MGQTSPPPEGVFSLLDTDLYKLTMQCAILKYFPSAHVTYSFTNRTPDMKFTRRSYNWLLEQISKLENIKLTEEELEFLQKCCSYLNPAYLKYLSEFRLKPSEQLEVSFIPIDDTGSKDDMGDVKIAIKGLWVETILYEIPLLALTSETYFKFCDRDWDYHQQEEKAFRKGCALLENGCIFSEFGTRRRRDYHTQNLVMEGLTRAAKKGVEEGFKGKFAGTSNVHFAMKYGIDPVGTVAHEWYMGIAAITNNYENANEIALRYWLGCFGEGVLGIALTDTFGTPTFLESFGKPVPELTSAEEGPEATMPSSGINTSETDSLTSTVPPIQKPFESAARNTTTKTYAQVFTGVRQDSGDPIYFLKMAKDFYEKEGIKDKKTVVFSDSLNIELCLEYKVIAEESGFQPTFGVGTFFTNDFNRTSNGKKSVPLNIVIKVSSAGGRPAVKLSDNLGKNTGDPKTVVEVKKRLGYVEHDWEDGDETRRWGKKED